MSVTNSRLMAIAAMVLAAFCLILTPDATAQRLDKKTIITIDQPFELPGVTLPAGKYVIELINRGDHSVVRFMDAAENKFYATVLGIPDYQLQAADKTELFFYESEEGTPRALRSWAYPGDCYRMELVYNEAKAGKIAPAEHAIATPEELAVSRNMTNLNAKTMISFTQPVEVAGTVLQPGAYVFKASSIDAHIIQVFDGSETNLMTSLMAQSIYRLDASKGTVVLKEVSAGSPMVLKSWFAPGELAGRELTGEAGR